MIIRFLPLYLTGNFVKFTHIHLNFNINKMMLKIQGIKYEGKNPEILNA